MWISLIFLLHILHYLPYCLFLLSVCCSVCFSASVCPAGTHGLMCSDHCKCENHGECHPVTGQCTCFPGFHGRFCEKGNLFFSSTVFYIVSREEKLVIWPRNICIFFKYNTDRDTELWLSLRIFTPVQQENNILLWSFLYFSSMSWWSVWKKLCRVMSMQEC